VRGGAALAAANIAGAAAGFFQAILVTRSLGPASYGRLAIIITFVTVTHRLLASRANEWVVREIGIARATPGSSRAARALLAAARVEALATIAALILVVALAAPAARWLVGDAAYAAFIRAYAVIIAFNVLTETGTGVLHAFGRFGTHAAVNTVERLAALGAIAAVIAAGGGFGAVVMAHAAGPICGGVLLAVLASRAARGELGTGWWRGVSSTPAEGWGPPLRFLASSNASGTLSLITRDADALWLGWLRGPVETGWYRLATSLAGILMVPTAALAQAVYPEATRAAAQRRFAELARLLRRGSALAAAWVAPAAIVVWLAGGTVTVSLFGADFRQAAPALGALMVGMGFANILFWSRPALLGLGLPGYALAATAVAAVVKVIGIVVFVPTGGYVAAAWVLSAVYVVGVGMSAVKVAGELRRGAGARAE
jgi:O-antigen/teichoic acid export membrane protein